MSQLDGFFSDAARNTDRLISDIERGSAEQAHAQLRAANSTIVSLKDSNAGNLAMKHLALRELAKVDPHHPLVRDAALREAVSTAAKKVMRMSDNWDDVRDLGVNYKVPGR
jgi:hypothetical protein